MDFNLDCEKYPNLKDLIFGKPSNPDYDGIHLNGPGAGRQLNYHAVQAIRSKITKPFQAVHQKKREPRAHAQTNIAAAREQTSWGKLGSDNHTGCPQALYQQRQLARNRGGGVRYARTYAEVTRNNAQYEYSVPTYNRFNHFLH